MVTGWWGRPVCGLQVSVAQQLHAASKHRKQHFRHRKSACREQMTREFRQAPAVGRARDTAGAHAAGPVRCTQVGGGEGCLAGGGFQSLGVQLGRGLVVWEIHALVQHRPWPLHSLPLHRGPSRTCTGGWAWMISRSPAGQQRTPVGASTCMDVPVGLREARFAAVQQSVANSNVRRQHVDAGDSDFRVPLHEVQGPALPWAPRPCCAMPHWYGTAANTQTQQCTPHRIRYTATDLVANLRPLPTRAPPVRCTVPCTFRRAPGCCGGSGRRTDRSRAPAGWAHRSRQSAADRFLFVACVVRGQGCWVRPLSQQYVPLCPLVIFPAKGQSSGNGR